MNKTPENIPVAESTVTMRDETSDKTVKVKEVGPPDRKKSNIGARIAAAIKSIIKPSG